MKNVKIGFSVLIGLSLAASALRAADAEPKPVTPNATPEAVELLKFFYSISGKHTLTAQHNFPGDKDKHTLAAAKAWGKTPAIFGKDWGFAKAGDKDTAYIRDEIADQLMEQYRKGSLVVMCWHEVPPTADEPVTFRDGAAAADPTDQSQYRARPAYRSQYKELLTPGTKLHQHWCAQVDAIVPYLEESCEAARVPLLWRPFHEMNGTWFWWGGRRGEYGTAAMYKMMFDRLVKFHKVKNLIWVWNVDRPEGTSLKFEECWPGSEYVDVLSLDCYREFKQSYYDELLKLADGKPIALGEVGGNLSAGGDAGPAQVDLVDGHGPAAAYVATCHEPPRGDGQGPAFLEPERSRLPQGHRAHSPRLGPAGRAARALGSGQS